jgi:23S rRNA (uracil1939-C5)-methyltransferase
MPHSGAIYNVQKPLYGGSFTLESLDGGDAGPAPPQQALVLPGELIRIGDAPIVIEASADRVEPGCVHFGVCGGCQYQHAAYPAQLAIKRQVLTGLLAGSGADALPEIATVRAEPWGYRNRIRMRLAVVAGELAAGYSVRGTNTFLPVRMCPIASPLLWRAVRTVLRLGREGAAQRWLRNVAELELFCTGDESGLQMTFFLRDPTPARNEPRAFQALCSSLRESLPELAGAEATIDPEAGRRVRKSWTGQTWGAPGLSYAVAGRAYWVSRASFFQVNRLLVDRLVGLVTAAGACGLAWDLFAGVGLFSGALAERFDRVIAVEGGDSGAADLVQNGRKTPETQGFTAVHAPTLDFLRAHQHQRERPELVVLDPPRAGLGTEAAAILGTIGPPRIVYASCDPVTLARDLTVLARAGYALDSVSLVDLFPQTFHLETVVELRR